MRREVTFGQAFFGLLVLFAAVAVISIAFLSTFEGHDDRALAFGLGGLTLAIWSGARITSRRPGQGSG